MTEGLEMSKDLSKNRHPALKNSIDHHFTSILPVSHTQATSLYYSLQSNNLPPRSPYPPQLQHAASASTTKVCSPQALTPHIVIYFIISIVLLYHTAPSSQGVWGKSAPEFPSHSSSKPSDLQNKVFCAFPSTAVAKVLAFHVKG